MYTEDIGNVVYCIHTTGPNKLGNCFFVVLFFHSIFVSSDDRAKSKQRNKNKQKQEAYISICVLLT